MCCLCLLCVQTVYIQATQPCMCVSGARSVMVQGCAVMNALGGHPARRPKTAMVIQLNVCSWAQDVLPVPPLRSNCVHSSNATVHVCIWCQKYHGARLCSYECIGGPPSPSPQNGYGNSVERLQLGPRCVACASSAFKLCTFKQRNRACVYLVPEVSWCKAVQ